MEERESSKASDLTNGAVKEIEEEHEKKSRDENRTGEFRVLYQVDATNLEMADHKRRILRSVVILSVEFAFVFVVPLFLNIYGAIILIPVIFFLLPSPFVLAPGKYKITKQGVLYNGQKVFQLVKKHRLKANQNRNFISVSDRKGEVLKLYTTESEKVMKILEKLIASEKTTRSKK